MSSGLPDDIINYIISYLNKCNNLKAGYGCYCCYKCCSCYQYRFTHYRDTVIEYLSTGDSTGSARYLISLDCEIESHFKHKDDFINAAVAAVKEFISEDIVNLQRIFTVESTYTYPMNIEAGINIETWIEEPTSYSVGLPIKVENSNESFYDLSSQKFLKKHIFTIK